MQVLTLAGQDFKVLLPVNMVAQIIGRSTVTPPSDGEFKSLAGSFRWREYGVPLLRTSELMGKSSTADEDYERIVVLWPMKSASSRSFIGLTSLAPPRVVEITDQPSAEMITEMPYALVCLQLENELAVIPDIDQVSRDLFENADGQY